MKAIRVAQGESAQIVDLSTAPGSGTRVKVEFSSLNYKDALAITGRGKIVRKFPLTLGVDLAGTIAEGPRAGEAVLATGWGLGESYDGGFAQEIHIPEEFLTPIPFGLTSETAMALGTAGLTAMLCIQEVESQIGRGPILVTGAGGGVGSISVALLRALGAEVVAVTGRPELAPWLTEIGASAVIARNEIADDRPLSKERWAAGIDTVGGKLLADLLKSTQYGGIVAACGLAGGSDLPTTVFPFILRGVQLAGVDSVRCPVERRTEAWTVLGELASQFIYQIYRVIPLESVPCAAAQLLDEGVRGRLVVDLRTHP